MQDHRRISDEFPIATIAFDRSIEVNHAVLEMELASFFHTGSLITWLRVTYFISEPSLQASRPPH